ncbi:50S ribosomal protein L15 [Candidatus Pacearchaeota archaeon CG_4_9_14_3_um_filter_31_7]|nr:MAG: hypothetical protein AUJ10_00940 [Candidatus Pacearchaeota archaeon CG1_02_31_27]PIN92378.1 MAG: 50S ribosomal protein L15 [Candidatus Pacearchaeota archaeon CG10_big_fil_rev_8_21_14_0_10_31_59]PIZ80681.1 MAG: 50S ribosomal protein L15 [Candidatus Pacearchaeota archaeon CG_4_10_14_0_2_um_filter_31_10]PJA70793.1 MAG: 50S ribosomal protein L15 [Candidatus Pacearchaeota archaeon CG_4_9_14_3_um_filter_31_7]
MKIKKRNKSSRRMGRRTCFWGARKKHRGKGNKGGKGMAGSGKRADQKKTLIISKYGKTYFGKFGFKSIQQKKNRKLKEINLQDIEKMIDYFKKKGLVKESKDNVEINLKGYKILSDGELTKKLIIKASGFSEKAIEKIEKKGGKAIRISEEKIKKEIKDNK